MLVILVSAISLTSALTYSNTNLLSNSGIYSGSQSLNIGGSQNVVYSSNSLVGSQSGSSSSSQSVNYYHAGNNTLTKISSQFSSTGTSGGTINPVYGNAVLNLYSNPSGAQVWYDQVYKGVTPLQIATTTGVHPFILSLPGYLPYQKNMNIPSSGTWQFIADLVPSGPITLHPTTIPITFPPTLYPTLPPYGSTLTIVSVPAGATVVYDGMPMGVTPVTFTTTTGRHPFTVSLSGYYPYQRNMIIPSYGNWQFNVWLVPQGNPVIYSSNPKTSFGKVS